MPTQTTIAFVVTRVRGSQDKLYINYHGYKEHEQFMALVRFLASQPGVAFGMKDDEVINYFDKLCGDSNSGVMFKIKCCKVKL